MTLLIITAFIVLVLVLFWRFRILRVVVHLSEPTRDFESATWKSESNFDLPQNNRSMMLDDLTLGVLQPGMKREQVRELLGPPENDPAYLKADLEQSDIYPIAKDEAGLRILVVEYQNLELTGTHEDNLVE